MQLHKVKALTAGGGVIEHGPGGKPFVHVTIHATVEREARDRDQEDTALTRPVLVVEEALGLYFDHDADAPAVLDTLILELMQLRARVMVALAELPATPPVPTPAPIEGVNADGDRIPF